MNDSPDIVNALASLLERLTPRSRRKERNRRYYLNRKERLKTVLNRLNPVLKRQPEWMQSLHHDSAHVVIDGASLCGAAVPAGGRWMPHNDCLRKCTRCQGRLKEYQS